MTQPSALEQEMLYYTNRMRTNPVDEYNLLVNSEDSNVNSAINFFNVDLNVLQDQWDDLTSAQTLAWSEQLHESSYNHNEFMIELDQQSHQLSGEPSLGERITDTGYSWNTLGEGVFAFAKSVFYGHAAFAIDWGFTATGIQNPAGHRNAIMNNNYREIGIDITLENDSTTSVGPLVITQDFGNRSALNGKGWLVGTVFSDLDKDNFYDPGEGLNDISISVTGINGTVFTENFNTWEAGGYQILLDSGNYQVEFTRNGDFLKNQNFIISSENVLIDLQVETVSDNNRSIIGSDGDDTLNGQADDELINGGLGNDILRGRAGNDTLEGERGNDRLYGGVGDDFLKGGIGRDKLYGGAGNDALNGGRGKDILKGGGGNDFLNGGRGKDKLYGGKGNDTFVILPGYGRDTIFDFNKGEDLIGIGQEMFNNLNKFGITTTTTNTLIEYDNELLVIIKGIINLEQGDFTII